MHLPAFHQRHTTPKYRTASNEATEPITATEPASPNPPTYSIHHHGPMPLIACLLRRAQKSVSHSETSTYRFEWKALCVKNHTRISQLVCQRTYDGNPTRPQQFANIVHSSVGGLGRMVTVGNFYRWRRVVCRFFRSVPWKSRGIQAARRPSQLGELTEFRRLSIFPMAKEW